MSFFISVDDGHPLDLKLADILAKEQLKAVFYVPINRPGSKILTKKQIRTLAGNFEIGGHTYNHVDLTKVNENTAYEEIIKGKIALEDILGKKVTSFAFPYGHYNDRLINLVRDAGFKNCRSGRIINFHPFNEKEFLRHPNFQIYPHKLQTEIRHCLKYVDLYSLSKRLILYGKDHMELIEGLPNEGDLHFWCHSQDIEKFNIWSFIHRLKSVGG